MSSYEEVKAQVEGLWREELAEIAAEREAVERRASEAWQSVEAHQGRAATLSSQLEGARSELVELPGKMGYALLQADEGEQLALQGHYASLKGTVAEQAQALEETHAAIGAASEDLRRAEEAGHALAVRENDLGREIWDQFFSLDTALLHHFARAVGADRLPTFIAAEREKYVAAVHREAQRLGKPEPGGIVVLDSNIPTVDEAAVVRPSQLAPHRA